MLDQLCKDNERPAQQELLREAWQRSGVASWELVPWRIECPIFDKIRRHIDLLWFIIT